MRKKLTALFLTFCLALTPFASAFAANGEGGTTPDLVISTAEKLAEFAEEVNSGTSYQGKLVVLDAPIDLAGVNWTPIGTESSPFKGTFDGEGFTVSNVTVNNADLEYAGLFGQMVGAEIKDLTVKNVSIQAKSYAGGLIGDAFTGTVSNCHVTGAIQIEANYKVGGLAGNGYASFYDCSVTGADDSTVAAVYNEADLEGDSAGGLIGFRGEGTSTVSGCSVSNLSVSGTRKVGGLIGSAYSDNSIVNCSVKDCSIATTAEKKYAESNKGTMGVGGLIGCYVANSQSDGKLSDCVVESVRLICPENIKNIAKLSYMVGTRYNNAENAVPNTVKNNMVTGENSGANVKSEDEVVSAVTPVAKIGDTYYGTLQEAIEALADNDILEIMPGEHDVTVTRTGNKQTYGSIFVIQANNVTVKPADAEKGATLYGFTNEYNDEVDNQGISGQATVYISGENVKLEGLTILPLGGYKGGDEKAFPTKTVVVKTSAANFTMTECTTAPNKKEKENQSKHNMMESAGQIHVSTNDATLKKNSFGEGTTVAAGWADTIGTTFYQVNASENYWGEGATAEEIAGKLDGPVKLESYYSDADMQELVQVGDYLVTNSKQLQDAINAAEDGDVIICAPGTYEENVSFNGKSVTVKAQYPAYTAEDGREQNDEKLSKFTGTFNTSEGSNDANFNENQTVVIEGFAFSGDGLKVGNTNYNTVGNLEVRNCTMEFGENLDNDSKENYNQYNYFVKVSGNSGTPYASVTVEENDISGTPAQDPFGIIPIQLWDVKKAVVQNNHIALDNAGESQAISISMLNPEAEVTVTGNEISGAGAGGIYVTTWKLGGNTTNAEEQFEGTITVEDNILSNVLGDVCSK